MKNIFPVYSIGHFINEPTNPTEFELSEFENMTEPDVAAAHSGIYILENSNRINR